MTLDLDRITHPLRLAKGSHQPGSGKGCAMNVISYINGDTKISDYPECSAKPLSRLVQRLNDKLADADGYLSPENSVLVLDLGWQTVGTADAPPEMMWQWLADLLVDPEHGVVKYAKNDGAAVAIRRVAALCARAAEGDLPTAGEWLKARGGADRAASASAADAATYAAYDADAAATHAADAAAYVASYAVAYTAAYAAAYAAADAAAYAADAAAYAADYAADAADYAAARIKFTRWAIQHWRQLAQLHTTTEIDTTTLNNALTQF